MFDCKRESDTDARRWCMLPAYQAGAGTTFWKYTNKSDDPDCLRNWTYYNSDGSAIIQAGVASTLKDNIDTWCPIKVYRKGGKEGNMWKYCS